MECDIDVIEEVAFSPARTLDVEPIYLLKREVVELRRCVGPLSHAFGRLQIENKDLISKEVRRYLRDVADHQTAAADQIASYDEMLNSLVQAALARVGMQQNTDMRKISAWAGIVAVPTMIAGIYGMNFEFMPELKRHWGYPVVISLMVLVCLFLYRNFRNKAGSSAPRCALGLRCAVGRHPIFPPGTHTQSPPRTLNTAAAQPGDSGPARRRRRSATPAASPRHP